MKKTELEKLKLFQLKNLAKRLKIPGRTKMNKDQLVDVLVGKKLEPKRVPARAARPAAAKPAPAKPARAAAPPPAKAAPALKPGAPPPHLYEPPELPERYHMDRLVLLPRDPNWLYAYWEVTDQSVANAARQLGVGLSDVKMCLRVHDVTGLEVDEDERPVGLAGSRSQVTIEIAPMANNWYIKVDQPGGAYCVEYLVMAPDGRTVSVMTSNVATTPSDRVSDQLEEEWGAGGRRRKIVRRARGAAASKWLAGAELGKQALASRMGSAPSSWPSSPGKRP